jgi:hypothetical protein
MTIALISRSIASCDTVKVRAAESTRSTIPRTT